jgi:hypothetical protein
MIRRGCSPRVPEELCPDRFPRRGHWRGGMRIALSCFGVVSVGLLVSGCGGGGSSSGVASLGSTSTTSPSAAYVPKGNSGSPATQLKYVQCIQAHGVPNFPEPGPSALAEMKKIDLNSPQFQSAYRAARRTYRRALRSRRPRPRRSKPRPSSSQIACVATASRIGRTRCREGSSSLLRPEQLRARLLT